MFPWSVALCAGMPPEKMLPFATQVVTLLNRKHISQNLSVLYYSMLIIFHVYTYFPRINHVNLWLYFGEPSFLILNRNTEYSVVAISVRLINGHCPQCFSSLTEPLFPDGAYNIFWPIFVTMYLSCRLLATADLWELAPVFLTVLIPDLYPFWFDNFNVLCSFLKPNLLSSHSIAHFHNLKLYTY